MTSSDITILTPDVLRKNGLGKPSDFHHNYKKKSRRPIAAMHSPLRKNNTTLLIILVMVMTIFSSICRADPPPFIVYMLSTYPPAVIFDRGIPARGTDYDFIRFISGASVEDRTSGYLVLSSSLEYTLVIAKDRLTNWPGVALYLYAVRPSDSFYDVMFSLSYARSALPEGEARDQVNHILWSRCVPSMPGQPETLSPGIRFIARDAFLWIMAGSLWMRYYPIHITCSPNLKSADIPCRSETNRLTLHLLASGSIKSVSSFSDLTVWDATRNSRA